MNATSSKKAIEILFEAYKYGGFPFFLSIAGLIILSGGTLADSWLNIVPDVDPLYVLIAGILVLLSGAFSWAFQAWLRFRVQAEIAGCLSRLIEGAGVAAPDGANYKVALEESLKMFPQVVEEFGKQTELQKSRTW